MCAMTAHSPSPPHRSRQTWGALATMILGPVSAAVTSFNSIVLLAVKIGRSNWRSRPPLENIISAGAIAIPIPSRFVSVLDDGQFGWRRLRHDVPAIECSSDLGYCKTFTEHNKADTTLCTIPPTSRLKSDVPALSPARNNIKTAFSILQLLYSSIQAYLKYRSTIHLQGLSCPYLIAIPYLYMSFINLIADLVQGTYTQIVVLTPSNMVRADNILVPSSERSYTVELNTNLNHSAPFQNIPTDSSDIELRILPPLSQPITTETSNESEGEQSESGPSITLSEEFDQWLHIHYPQIELDNIPWLTSHAYFLHFLVALAVILIWVALLTNFKGADTVAGDVLLFAIIGDPILHLLLGVVQMGFGCKGGLGLGFIVTCKIWAWMLNLIGCLLAGKTLYQLWKN